jgi:hypothetical protein
MLAIGSYFLSSASCKLLLMTVIARLSKSSSNVSSSARVNMWLNVLSLTIASRASSKTRGLFGFFVVVPRIAVFTTMGPEFDHLSWYALEQYQAHGIRQPLLLKHDPLNLIKPHGIAATIIQTSRPCRFIPSHLLRDFELAGILDIGGDAGRPIARKRTIGHETLSPPQTQAISVLNSRRVICKFHGFQAPPVSLLVW